VSLTGETMLAVRAVAWGDPSVLRAETLARPKPGPGQALVEIKAAGVNFFDTQLRSGLYKFGGLPLALGNEGAGVVLAIGEGASIPVGARVAWVGVSGSYASHVVAPADKLVVLPEALGFADAAAGLFQGMTAHYLAFSVGQLGPGKSCLVHSASGGVGLLLCQMATMRGARVIGSLSDLAKGAAAQAAGADPVLSYLAEDFVERVKAETDGAGVDVVYDAVGLQTFEKSLAVLKRRGLLALYGEASGLVPPFDVRALANHGSLMLTRTGLKDFMTTPEEYRMRAGDVLAWLADDQLKLHAVASFPLSQAAEAHRALESRRTSGKILLIP
jgi:NADPH2:quinone reductase